MKSTLWRKQKLPNIKEKKDSSLQVAAFSKRMILRKYLEVQPADKGVNHPGQPPFQQQVRVQAPSSMWKL